MADMNASIRAFCEEAIELKTTPGVVVGYIRGGHQQILPLGRLTYEADAPATSGQTLYDVASITKSIPTSSVILKLVEAGRLALDDKAADYLPELANDYRDQITIRHLLTFTVYFDIGRTLASLAKEDPSGVIEALMKAPLAAPPGERYTYSNAPSLLLAVIAERVSGKALDEVAHELFFAPLGMRRTTFRPQAFSAGKVAPTEIDWRGEVRGLVHDPAAWAMVTHGRIPGHAGLFSTVEDLLRFAQMLLNEGELDGKRYFKPETVRMMHTDQTPHLEGKAGLGWEIDRVEAQGRKVSLEAFGKTGFTGTTILIDPIKQVAMVALANRTYPHHSDREAILKFWSGLSDLVFE
jgi:beta-N-acetylhexosaminidase